MEKYLSIKPNCRILLIAAILCIRVFTIGQSIKGFTLVEKKDNHRIEVYYNKILLTSYVFEDTLKKPILFPVNTIDGITVTRSYPIQKITGERTDHPHHAGIWLNYESVNGLDFWNNSTAIPSERRHRYGYIIHSGIKKAVSTKNKAYLETTAKWLRPDAKNLLDETSIYHFTVRGNDFIIDRITTLTAKDTTVVFKDVKDGMFAIRVIRELELPSKEKSNFVDIHGNTTTVDPSADEANGMYYGSNGLQGEKVWGTKGNWMMLSGKKAGKEITVAMIDHPANPGYPTYWHARGYGLFAANPLGRKVFSNGAEELNFTLKPNESATFRYRVIIHSGNIFAPAEMEKWAKEFSALKY